MATDNLMTNENYMMSRTSGPLFAGLLLVLLAGATSSPVAQERAGSLSLEALLAAPSLGYADPSIAPDGSEIAYTVIDNARKPSVEDGNVHRTGVPWFALGSDIWISRIPGGEARNLTAGRGNNWAPAWSPDGRRVAFLSDRSGSGPVNQAHLWVWEETSDKLRRVTDVPVMDPGGKLGRLHWLEDSRTVVVKAYPEGISPSQYATLLKTTSQRERSDRDTNLTVQVLRVDPSSDGPAPRTDALNLARLRGELALVNVETGAVRRISGSTQIASYALSPDRRTLAWAEVTRYEKPGAHPILANLVVCDVQGGKPRRLVQDARLAYGYPVFPLFTWAPTSQAIAYRTDGAGMPDDVYVVRLAGGSPRRVAKGPVHSRNLWAEPVLWAPDGRQLLWMRSGTLWRASADGEAASPIVKAPGQELWPIPRESGGVWSVDGRSAMVFTKRSASKLVGLARVDLASGRITQLHEEPKAYGFPVRYPVVTPDNKAVVYAAESPQSPANFWLARAENRAQPRQLTRIADSLGTGGGRTSVLDWRSLNGDSLHGALIYPDRYENGVKYPLIVKVYGGEDLSDEVNRFGSAVSTLENARIFTSRGYAVLLADSRAEVGTPMRDLLTSLLPGVDRAIDAGVADPARIGVTGHSYGGYTTLALIVQSRRFKAAVMRAGLGDLVSAYGQLGDDGTNYLLPWAEHGQGRMGGTPWEVRDRYIENSPIHYLDRVETPLLIVHGAEDAAFLADQVFSGLRRLGKPVEYARYRGEGHFESLWSRANQLDYLNRVISWFDRYLKGGAGADSSTAGKPRSTK